MSKHDEFLTEVVYEIDDIVYEYYRRSNELIATKRNQEKLLSYRDKTITTVNDMNVRSLDIIASFKRQEMVDDRAQILLERNRNILDSSLEVISNSPDKSDFLRDVSNAASTVYDGAKKAINKVEESEAFAKIKSTAADGYVRLRDVVGNISKDPRVQDGVKAVKETSKDIYDAGSKVVKDGAEKVKDWINDSKTKAEDVADKAEDVVEETTDAVKETVADVKDVAEKVVNAAGDVVEDVKIDVNNRKRSVVEEAQEQLSEMKDVAEDVLGGESE